MQNDKEIIDGIPEATWRAIEKTRAKANFVFAILFASCGALLLAITSSLVEAIFSVSAFAIGAIWVVRSLRALRKAYGAVARGRKDTAR